MTPVEVLTLSGSTRHYLRRGAHLGEPRSTLCDARADTWIRPDSPEDWRRFPLCRRCEQRLSA